MKKITFVEKTIKFMLTLLYPGRCPVCDNVVSMKENLICYGCRKKWKVIRDSFCLKCGRPLADKEQEYCLDCGRRTHLFIQGRALYKYSDTAKSIYRFKYGGRCEYAEFFGKKMAKELRTFVEGLRPDGLVPVPLSKKRMNRRGYNQAQQLAVVLGREWGVPVYGQLVSRIRDTAPQKELNALQRQNNLKKAFKIAQNDVKLNTVIIVDDIYTTGSTMDAIASVLQQTGVQRIYFIALAIGAVD